MLVCNMHHVDAHGWVTCLSATAKSFDSCHNNMAWTKQAVSWSTGGNMPLQALSEPGTSLYSVYIYCSLTPNHCLICIAARQHTLAAATSAEKASQKQTKVTLRSHCTTSCRQTITTPQACSKDANEGIEHYDNIQFSATQLHPC